MLNPKSNNVRIMIISTQLYHAGYGSMGIIQSVEGSRVKVQLTVDDEPMLEQLRTSLDEHDEEWVSSNMYFYKFIN